MVAFRSRAKVSRAMAVVALAYALALQLFLGGFGDALHAPSRPADALALAAICSPAESGTQAMPGTGLPTPGHRYGDNGFCCILGCGAGCNAGAIPARYAITAAYAAARPVSYHDLEPDAASPSVIAGSLGARAPPVVA